MKEETTIVRVVIPKSWKEEIWEMASEAGKNPSEWMRESFWEKKKRDKLPVIR